MIILFLMLIILLFWLFFIYSMNGNRINSPTSLLSIGYITTTIFSMWNVGRWGSNITLDVIVIILIGVISFGFSEILVYNTKRRKMAYRINDNNTGNVKDMLRSIDENERIRFILFLGFICLVCSYMVYKEVHRIAYADFKTWGNVAYNYRKNRKEVGVSGVTRISLKITKAIAYLCIFELSNKIVIRGKKIKLKSVIVFIIPIFFYSYQSVITGGRIGVISMLISFFVSYIILTNIYSGKKWKVNFKRILLGVTIIGIGMIVFYKAQDIVGRLQTSTGVMDYVGSYLGGSIELFSQYLKRDTSVKSYESFAGLIDNIQRYFHLLGDIHIVKSHEFGTSVSGVLIGNTYTGFRNYYNDFGIIGVVGLSFLLSLIFNKMYCKVIYVNKVKIEWIVAYLFYLSQIYSIFFHFFTDYFFPNISLNMVIDIIFFTIICYVRYSNIVPALFVLKKHSVSF